MHPLPQARLLTRRFVPGTGNQKACSRTVPLCVVAVGRSASSGARSAGAESGRLILETVRLISVSRRNRECMSPARQLGLARDQVVLSSVPEGRPRGGGKRSLGLTFFSLSVDQPGRTQVPPKNWSMPLGTRPGRAIPAAKHLSTRAVRS